MREPSAPYSPLEQEVIVLRAVLTLIDRLVNWEMLVKSEQTTDVCLLPSTISHKRLFNVLLVDLLSKPKDGLFDLPKPAASSSQVDRTYLFYLKRICAQPTLSAGNEPHLRSSVDTFAQWLEADCVVQDVWLPAVELKLDMRLKRIEFLRICGNIAKHNFSRLERDVDRIRAVLRKNGHEVDSGRAFLIVPEFYEWFHTNILGYHISQIAKMLNDIRWGIYRYLRPHFEHSFTQGEPFPPVYSYQVPPECANALTRSIYWDLMNDTRSPPFMQEFDVDPFLQLRY